MPEALVANVLLFLRTLSTALKQENDQAAVVWYACLDVQGRLRRQQRLDSDNAAFFACVDALYTDYKWRADDAKYAAAFNLDRRWDVFMGVDVFGRHGTLGGGQLQCDVALRAAWNAGVSAALFAPGWTHECLRHDAQYDGAFEDTEHALWTAVRSAWKRLGPASDALAGPPCVYSAFNVGRGRGVWVLGAKRSAKPWHDLRQMDLQPTPALHVGVPFAAGPSRLQATLTHDDAFQGGTSVSIQVRQPKCGRLFRGTIFYL